MKKKKKSKIIIIPGERISRKKFLEELNNYRLNSYKRQLGLIRLSDLSNDQKRIQSSFIRSRMEAIKREREY